jgi:hypothetical protein
MYRSYTVADVALAVALGSAAVAVITYLLRPSAPGPAAVRALPISQAF